MEMKAMSTEEEEFLGWKAMGVTQNLFRLLHLWEQGLKNQWAAGNFLRETSEESAIANAAAIGQLDVLHRLQELDYEQFSAGLEGDE